MASRELRNTAIGFGSGVLFILLSGLITGGLFLADFLSDIGWASNFMLMGIPYSFIAGLMYFLVARIRAKNEYILKFCFLFGFGFWLSFAIFYILGYFAFSGFGF